MTTSLHHLPHYMDLKDTLCNTQKMLTVKRTISVNKCNIFRTFAQRHSERLYASILPKTLIVSS